MKNTNESLKWWSSLSKEELDKIMQDNFNPHVLPHKLENNHIKKLYNKLFSAKNN